MPHCGLVLKTEMNLLQSFQPPLHLCLAAAHLVTVDAELARDLGLREGFLHVVSAGGQAAALVGGEGDDGLSIEVDVLEQREHHLRVGAPPYRTADEDGVVLRKVGGGAFVRRQLALVGLFLGQFDEWHIGHAVILVGDNLKLVGTFDFSDVVGHDLGVADLDVAHAVLMLFLFDDLTSCLFCALQLVTIRSARAATIIVLTFILPPSNT